MTEPLVDLTIAVHSATRPIARAVASVLERTTAAVRVSVVAHNIDPDVIRANLGSWAEDPRVRLLELQDGVASPAGPMNLGLARSTARFTSVMGSDDELQPGAIDSWLALQRESNAAAVIARIFHTGRGNDAYPPVRPGRRRRLDAVRDRLAYRSAPLGLVSREHFGHLRFTEGLPSGEDLAYVTFMWFSGEPISFDRTGPAYVVHQDADNRVTHEAKSVREDFRFLDEIFGQPWFERFTAEQRRALAVKLVRLHVFDAILSRNRLPWRDGERAALAAVVDRILGQAPGTERLLSRIDREVLETALREDTPSEQIARLLESRWNYRSVTAMLPRNVLYALHRQAPFRTLFAGSLVMRPVKSGRGAR